MKKQIISASMLVVGFLVGATALSTIAAWSEPTGTGPCTPPNCNVAAPINVGSVAQGRIGALGIGTSTPKSGIKLDVYGSGLFTDLGVVGKTILNGGLDITSGSPTYGKVLMSTNASGTVSWVATSSLGISGGTSVGTSTGSVGGGCYQITNFGTTNKTVPWGNAVGLTDASVGSGMKPCVCPSGYTFGRLGKGNPTSDTTDDLPYTGICYKQ